MLKCRVIPILTFNGFALVKTKQFGNPRMVGNAVQAAKVYNTRNVDELVFLDIYASDQKRKINLNMVRSIINECFMPVAIGGGITTLEDIHALLEIGADKVVIKNAAILDPDFINKASEVYGNQCITLAIDVIKEDGTYYIYNRLDRTISLDEYLEHLSTLSFGEVILNNVTNDGMQDGFDTDLVKYVEQKLTVPIVAVGGGGNMEHFKKLFSETSIEAVGAASIFHFTRYTPLDIKAAIHSVGRPVRILENNQGTITNA